MENILKQRGRVEKDDMSKQDDAKVKVLVEAEKKREAELVLLKITDRTSIYVPANKKTKEYAEWYRHNRLNLKKNVDNEI